VRVCSIDPHDDSAFDAWYAILQATDEERWGDPDGGLSRREIHAAVCSGHGALQHECLAALNESGAMVGIGLCAVPQRDNQHGASIDIRVAGPHRRHGVGSLILTEVERRLAAAGRSVVSDLIEVPLAAVATDPSGPFAVRNGFVIAQTGHRRNLVLPVDPDRLARLRAEVDRAGSTGSDGSAGSTGSTGGEYLVHTFAAPWPERYLDDQCALYRRMSTDEPSGDEQRQEQVWDAARIAETDALAAAQGMTRLVAVAEHVGSGRLVAFSELALPQDHPTEAWQLPTLVLGEHRGHRLGLAVKLANLDSLRRLFPNVALVVTGNAQENTPMIAINEMLGFEVVANGTFWQKELGVRA
jgi:GNAT superfamily N-acetyltransferase